MDVINLNEKFNLFNEHWTPKLLGELNGQSVKIAKVKGEFVWHNHKNEDELFFIIKGTLKIELKNKTITLNEGEMTIIPRGVEHRPVAEEEVWLMLFEPSDTKHTGNVDHELTKKTIEKI
jgi:mannose-6-phosphate isomerase-like protein (cupin superfamily)